MVQRVDDSVANRHPRDSGDGDHKRQRHVLKDGDLVPLMSVGHKRHETDEESVARRDVAGVPGAGSEDVVANLPEQQNAEDAFVGSPDQMPDRVPGLLRHHLSQSAVSCVPGEEVSPTPP